MQMARMWRWESVAGLGVGQGGRRLELGRQHVLIVGRLNHFLGVHEVWHGFQFTHRWGVPYREWSNQAGWDSRNYDWPLGRCRRRMAGGW